MTEVEQVAEQVCIEYENQMKAWTRYERDRPQLRDIVIEEVGELLGQLAEANEQGLTNSVQARADFSQTLKDSGTREEWDTGSRRDTREGKGRYDLLPWAAIRALARIMEEGAKKYGDRNWEKGQPCSRYFDSALRHLGHYAQGHDDEPHLWQALWNISCLIETQDRIESGSLPRELDDMPGGIPDYERLFWTAKDTNDFEEGLRRDRERIEAEENRRDRHKEKQE